MTLYQQFANQGECRGEGTLSRMQVKAQLMLRHGNVLICHMNAAAYQNFCMHQDQTVLSQSLTSLLQTVSAAFPHSDSGIVDPFTSIHLQVQDMQTLPCPWESCSQLQSCESGPELL